MAKLKSGIKLEAQKLKEKARMKLPIRSQGHRIYLDHSDGNNVWILVDPRFSVPSLILLDFVIVYIVFALTVYSVGVFLPGKVGQIIFTAVEHFYCYYSLLKLYGYVGSHVLLRKKGRLRRKRTSRLIL